MIGAKGTWYALSPVPGATPASEASLRRRFAAAFFVLRPRYVARGRARGLTNEEVLAALLDAIWRTIAPGLGLQYDRLERTRDGND